MSRFYLRQSYMKKSVSFQQSRFITQISTLHIVHTASSIINIHSHNIHWSNLLINSIMLYQFHWSIDWNGKQLRYSWGSPPLWAIGLAFIRCWDSWHFMDANLTLCTNDTERTCLIVENKILESMRAILYPNGTNCIWKWADIDGNEHEERLSTYDL